MIIELLVAVIVLVVVLLVAQWLLSLVPMDNRIRVALLAVIALLALVWFVQRMGVPL